MTKDRVNEEAMKSMFLPSEERKEKGDTMIENLNWNRKNWIPVEENIKWGC